MNWRFLKLFFLGIPEYEQGLPGKSWKEEISGFIKILLLMFCILGFISLMFWFLGAETSTKIFIFLGGIFVGAFIVEHIYESRKRNKAL